MGVVFCSVGGVNLVSAWVNLHGRAQASVNGWLWLFLSVVWMALGVANLGRHGRRLTRR